MEVSAGPSVFIRNNLVWSVAVLVLDVVRNYVQNDLLAKAIARNVIPDSLVV